MNDVQALLDLPLETLVVLAAGYAGYRIAYSGKDKSHRPIDIALISLAFGLVAKVLFGVVEVSEFNQIVRPIVAGLGAALSAVFWRKWGEGWAQYLLRASEISYSDGTVSAWETIISSTRYKPSQLIVQKTNGSQLMCRSLNPYKSKPHGPCLYGEDGSIALYVTHYRADVSKKWEDIDVIDDDFGAVLTYIPSNRIDEIEIRNT